jgi:hypothetical protein
MSECIYVCRSCAGTLSEDCDAVGVATKVSYIIVDPLNSRVNIKEPKILRPSRADELRRVWLTKDVKPIVESHDRDVIVVPYKVLSDVCRYVALQFIAQ